MTLRTKNLVAIAPTLVLAVGLLYAASRNIVRHGFAGVEQDLLRSFAKIEAEGTRQDVRRARDALLAEVENLSVKASDWAQWDDTYRFVVDRNEAYRRSNLKDAALSDLKLNLIVIIGPEGRPVFERWYDLEQGRAAPLPRGLLPELLPGKPLLAHRSVEDVHSGILLLPDGPLMIVSRPITTSEGKGELRGSVVFGRLLNEAGFRRLAALTHLSMRWERARGTVPAGFFPAERGAGSEELGVAAAGPEVMAGYALVRDLAGEPAFFLHVRVPREIYRQGLVTAQLIQGRGRVIFLSLVTAILLAGAVLAGVVLLVLERSVLRRLSRLSREAVGIGRDGDFSGRVEARGEDEISELARSVNAMLDDLSASHRVIDEGRARLRLVMDAVPAGLLSLDEELRVQPDFSKAAARLLGHDVAGRRFLDVLGLREGAPERRAVEEFLELLLRDLVPEDSMAELNPLREFRYDGSGTARWLRLEYYLIRQGGDLPNHLLVILEDVTQEKVLGARAAESEQENLYLRALAEDPELFREVLAEGRSILRRVAEKVAGFVPGEALAAEAEEIFREVHTLKGAAASFAMLSVAEGCSRVEDSLEVLRKGEPPSPEDLAAFGDRFAFLSGAFSQVSDGAARLFGEAEEEGAPSLRIPAHLIAHHIRAIEEAAREVGIQNEGVRRMRDEAVERLRSFRSVPARKVFARSLRAVSGLARRLGKEVEFRFEGADIRIDWELGAPLNRALLHLIRNCLDHGIEPPDERVSRGKPSEGRLLLRASREDGQLRIVVSDDGRGIDREGLRSAARRSGGGADHPEEASVCDGLSFAPGVSTAPRVTEVSGRGVGMDVVLRTVKEELGGDVLIESSFGEGTRFTLLVPMGH